MHTTTKAERNVETVLVIEEVKLEVWAKDEKGKVFASKMSLFKMQLVRPDIAKIEGLTAPRVSVNRTVKVLREDGKKDLLNIGGWYVRQPEAKRPSSGERVSE